MPSKEFESVIAMFSMRPDVHTLSVAEQRENFERGVAFFPVESDVVVQQTTVAGRPCEWLTPAGANSDYTLLFLHGGGYCIGSLNTHRGLASNIARAAGCRALNVDYRLAPEHPHPAAVDDAIAVYRALIDSGHRTDHIIIAGDSAGGGLTLATAISLRDAGLALPKALVCLSPWTDLTQTAESITSKAAIDPFLGVGELDAFADYYAGALDKRAHLISPHFADLHGLPPLLIHVGTREILLDDSTSLAEKARAAGVDVTLLVEQDMVHVWHMLSAITPEGQDGVVKAGKWIQSHLKS